MKRFADLVDQLNTRLGAVLKWFALLMVLIQVMGLLIQTYKEV